MNICFIGHFTAGGTECATFLVANGLSDKYNVSILNTCDRAPSFNLDPSVKFDYLKTGCMPKRIIYLRKYLRENKIDVLITVEAMTGVLSILAAKTTRCKHVVWEHANFYQNQGSRWIQKIRQLELFCTDAYVVLTERDKNNFINNFKIKTNLEQIYNIANQQSDHMYNINSKTIISVGHLRKVKNFVVIPDIAKRVFARYPDWNWKIYGDTNGDQYQLIKNKIDEFGLQNHVLFCGRCSKMDTAYQQASIYVMTSLQEGLPMVLLEAKVNKIPLVSFDIETGPDEIIREGINGYLVPAYEIETMADKICRLIEEPELRKNFSDCTGLDLEKFSADMILKRWDNLIENISGISSKYQF